MAKLYAILSFDSKYIITQSQYNLDGMIYFSIMKNAIQSNIESITSKIIQTTAPNNVYIINEKVNDVDIVIYGSAYQNYHVIITNKMYPPMVAKQLLHHMIKETQPVSVLFEQYQDPSKFDKIDKIKTELEDTRVIILESIEQLLKRGESIDELQEKAEQLQASSAKFVDDAKYMNRCCKLF